MKTVANFVHLVVEGSEGAYHPSRYPKMNYEELISLYHCNLSMYILRKPGIVSTFENNRYIHMF